MSSKRSFSVRFREWVEGDRPPRLELTLHDPHVRSERPQLILDENAMRRRLLGFLRRYHVLATALSAALFVILLSTVLALPPFGAADNPTNNEVSEEYLTHGNEQTGGKNAVTAMIFTYRGFDTLGESCVLFLALGCVLLLLRREKGDAGTLADRFALSREEHADEEHRDAIFVRMSEVATPCIFLYGFYVLLGGESSPGGGFSAGAILSAGLILYASANGVKKTRRFLNEKSFAVIRTAGLVLYAVLFAAYIFSGGGDSANPISRYLVLPIDIAVGLVVMCTMYGFYAMFARGEI